jgi:hypothetical protein
VLVRCPAKEWFVQPILWSSMGTATFGGHLSRFGPLSGSRQTSPKLYRAAPDTSLIRAHDKHIGYGPFRFEILSPNVALHRNVGGEWCIPRAGYGGRRPRFMSQTFAFGSGRATGADRFNDSDALGMRYANFPLPSRHLRPDNGWIQASLAEYPPRWCPPPMLPVCLT